MACTTCTCCASARHSIYEASRGAASIRQADAGQPRCRTATCGSAERGQHLRAHSGEVIDIRRIILPVRHTKHACVTYVCGAHRRHAASITSRTPICYHQSRAYWPICPRCLCLPTHAHTSHTSHTAHVCNTRMFGVAHGQYDACLLYTSPSPRDS